MVWRLAWMALVWFVALPGAALAQPKGLYNGLLGKELINVVCDLTTYEKASDCVGELVPILQVRAAHFAAAQATYLVKVNYEPGVPGSVAGSAGTAFMVDATRGYFITAKHVLVGRKVWSSLLPPDHTVKFSDLESAIEDHLARTAQVTLQTSEDALPVSARLIGLDRNTDLALLAVGDVNALPMSKWPPLFKPIALAAPEHTCADMTVIALGFQSGEQGRMERRGADTFTEATCSLQPNTYWIGELKYRIPLHKTRLVFNAGNSGGPVLDERRHLVGVVSGARPDAANTNNYFVPVAAVRAFLDRFR